MKTYLKMSITGGLVAKAEELSYFNLSNMYLLFPTLQCIDIVESLILEVVYDIHVTETLFKMYEIILIN